MGRVLRLPLERGALRPAPGGWGQERRLAWLLWAACPGVGWVRLRAIEARFGSLLEAWHAPSDAFLGLPGVGPGWLRQLDRFRAQWGTDPLEAFAVSVAGGRRVLLPGDPPYPPAVASLERPALALHWQGEGSLWPLLARRAAVAVVGTRRPSRHGLAMAESLGAALAKAGWPVVSGLAEGIDAAAHRGCLAHQGHPVAVLGTPLERVYPRHHTQLQRQVGEQGLLITEQSPGAPVRPGHFAARNRLQVALVRAVVLVECPERSGALQSAGLAWQQQLPLWVVPADAARLSARGSNRLLVQGATALLDPADLIRQLGPGPLTSRVGSLPMAPAAPPRSGGEAALLAALAEGASLEQLCAVTQEPGPQLAARLLSLELAGLVRAEPGLRWRRL